MITWDDSMSTGLPEIDSQHKMIIEKFNELSTAIEERRGRSAAGPILDFLQFYAVWHFGREEKCMEQYQCPAAAANKRGHAEFLEKFGQLYEQYQEVGIDSQLVQTTYGELADWINHHIRQVDAQLYPCVMRFKPAGDSGSED